MRSKNPASEGNILGRLEQHDRALGIGDSEDEHLRSNRSDLSRWEVCDRDHQPADQLLGLIVHGELGARPPRADGAEVDQQLVGRLSSFRKGQGLDHSADAHLDAFEIRDVNGGSLAQRP